MNIELIQHPHKGLTQWDLGRRVRVPACDEVHFAMQRDRQSLVVLPEVDGTQYVADVPNQLLVHSGVLLIWTVTDNISKHKCAIPVDKKPQPTDYVYEPTEYVDVIEMLENLDERVRALEAAGGVNPDTVKDLVDERVMEYTSEINEYGELIITGN